MVGTIDQAVDKGRASSGEEDKPAEDAEPEAAEADAEPVPA
jgi:hypothetical protein